MAGRRRWFGAAIAVAGLCAPSLAAEAVIDFEPTSGYLAGQALSGQSGWVATLAEGGTARVVNGNGPTRGGGQCAELSNLAGSAGCERICLEKAMADVVSTGGPLVTLQYDLRLLSPDRQWAEVSVPGMSCAHYWMTACQWRGCREPAGTNAEWHTGPSFAQGGEWHTVRWTVLYGDHGNGQAGELMSIRIDDVEHPQYPEDFAYLEAGATQPVDRIRLYLDDYWGDDGSNDVLWLDNIVVSGVAVPGSLPVANAGDDVTHSPGSWYGVVLDGGGSTDDGRIVRYRWTEGYGGAVVYDGPEAAPLVDLEPGIHGLVLEVFDDTGLRDTDSAVYAIGARPAIVDEVAGPWGIRNADISGTGASDRIPAPVAPGQSFEMLGVVETANCGQWGPPADGSTFTVDYFGNLYYLNLDNYLESFSKDLRRRWRGHDLDHQIEQVRLGDWPAGSGALIAGVRYIYAVGGGESASSGQPSLYAFDKRTGQMGWRTRLAEEDWTGVTGRAKTVLYANKLYVVGHTRDDGYVHIYQIDATDGALDWSSAVLVEMQRLAEPNAGTVVFVPNAHGDGKHCLLWNQMSADGQAAASDGLADMVSVEVDPASGAHTVWGPAEGIDGPGLCFSHPIYSRATGRVYTPSYKTAGYWPSGLYVWSPSDGYVGACAGSGAGAHHGSRDVFALDFDGRTVHAAGESDSFRSYTDHGDGTWNVVYRTFGGYAANGFGFYGQGALLKDDRGHAVYLTATEGDPSNPTVPAKVVALDLSEPADPSGNTPIAEWVCQEWDAARSGWDYPAPQVGPIPGPDGSIYIAQSRGCERTRIVRLGRTGLPATGACCVHSSCAPDLTPAACTALGGAFHGVGSACAPANPCPACHGDADCSAAVNFDDINYFVAALAGGSSGWAVHYAGQHGGQPPSCPYGNCDANGDGTVNFDDINPFVAKLVNPPACP